jgi:hypothetical protein
MSEDSNIDYERWSAFRSSTPEEPGAVSVSVITPKSAGS